MRVGVRRRRKGRRARRRMARDGFRGIGTSSMVIARSSSAMPLCPIQRGNMTRKSCTITSTSSRSGVDTYLANPNAQVPWYPSKRLPSILKGYRRGDREFFRGHFSPNLSKKVLEERLDDQVRFLNRYLDLAEAGVDWVAEIAKACRQRRVAPWLSIRMNDLHGANSWEHSYMNCALQKDPRYRLSGRQINPRDGIDIKLQALDYGHREVRDYMM